MYKRQGNAPGYGEKMAFGQKCGSKRATSKLARQASVVLKCPLDSSMVDSPSAATDA